MSDPDRGAYTPPTDAPLSFDARQPVRGGGPAPMMLILSAIVLIALVIAIVLFYRSGVREAGQPPQTVGAPVGAMKAAPPAEDQPADPAAGLQIYQSEKGGVDEAYRTPNFTAPPEEPKVRAPVAVAPPPKAAPTSPIASAPIAALPAAPPSGLKPAVPPPAVPVTKTAPPPAPKAAAPAPVATAPVAPAPKAAAGGGAAVQIGAFSSRALADEEWAKAARVSGGAGKGKHVEAVEKGSSTLYRTQLTGFASRAEASAFCDRLKAAGKNCFVK